MLKSLVFALSFATVAIHSSQAEVTMGEAFASHHSVLPDCYSSVCGSISGVRLQTSLE